MNRQVNQVAISNGQCSLFGTHHIPRALYFFPPKVPTGAFSTIQLARAIHARSIVILDNNRTITMIVLVEGAMWPRKKNMRPPSICAIYRCDLSLATCSSSAIDASGDKCPRPARCNFNLFWPFCLLGQKKPILAGVITQCYLIWTWPASRQ